jgi:TonB family protein
MLPQSEFGLPPDAAPPPAVSAIAALTQDRALIGLLRGTVDPSNELIIVNSEAELAPQLQARSVSAALIDSMFVEGDLSVLTEGLRERYPDLVLVVVGTAEEQARVAAQITSGVVYRFLHRPVSAPRVRLFVDAALKRHEVELTERTLEQKRPDFSQMAEPKKPAGQRNPFIVPGVIAALLIAGGVGFAVFQKSGDKPVTADTEQTAEQTKAADEDTRLRPAAASITPESRPAPPVAAAPAPVSTPAPERTPTVSPPAAAPVQNVQPEVRPAQIQPPAPAPAPAPAVPTKAERVREILARAEAALQKGDLVAPATPNANDLFRSALAEDPANSLAKAGLVRVADRLLGAAEKELTAGRTAEAKRLVDTVNSLSPGNTRGAFLAMQIAKENERTALAKARESAEKDRQDKGATYLRLAGARMRTGNLIDPAEDNARFYIEAARALVPGDPILTKISRDLQGELLDRAAVAARSGNAAETERWLVNAEGAGALPGDISGVRRVLNDTQVAAKAARITEIQTNFAAALSGGQLVGAGQSSAKAQLLALEQVDSTHPAAREARAKLGGEMLREVRIATARSDFAGADRWLAELRAIDFGGPDVAAAERDLASARGVVAARSTPVSESQLQRTEYVAPKVPLSARRNGIDGWVELEFTVRADGVTDQIVVTNSNPKRVYDEAAVAAVSEWRYRPVMRDGRPVEQRTTVRIRFTEEQE